MWKPVILFRNYTLFLTVKGGIGNIDYDF